MRNHFANPIIAWNQLAAFALASSLTLPLPALAASIALATAPLTTATTTTVKPNLLLVLDNSGSMDWDHMPDDASDGGSAVTFSYGYYGLRSNQCNQAYYDPSYTYLPPVDATGTSYANATFTSALNNGFNAGSGTVNLQTSFIASQSLNADTTGGTAYYYNYSGTQTSQLQKNYNSTTNTFYNECHSAQGASPGKDVFTKIVLSNAATATTATIVASCSSCTSTSVSSVKLDGIELLSSTPASTISPTALAADLAARITQNGVSASASGSTVTLTGLPATASSLIVTQSGSMTLTRTIFPVANAAKLTNFANWYSFYRTRLLMMKTATGNAFSTLGNSYRVGLMKISASNSPSVPLGTFESTQRSDWYTALYATTTSGSTPLRTALSNAGRYFAGKLSVADPMQYSCQQNFAIMSTDGYWNSGDDINLNGTNNSIGNQDGLAGRPMFDGSQATSLWTFTYTRNSYSKVTDTCTGGNKKLKTQPQIGTCTKSVSTGSCTPTNWIDNGAATLGSVCDKVAAPAPTTPVQQGAAVETVGGSSGGSSDSLADVAMYYYQTDLRTPALNNCTSGSTGATLCSTPSVAGEPDPYNNVFTSSSDNNTKQHMTTFTLGLGASGWMNYSPSYLNDTSGDFVSVKQGFTANSSATPPVCSWQADGTVCNWPIPGMDGSSNGLIANIDDLWHAAVDGHGAYFSATNPSTLSSGLSNALAGVKTRKGSAAAAATSTLNPVAGNNFAYFASYTTVAWKGNLEARGINVDTGVINQNAIWCVENIVADICTSPSSVVASTSGGTTSYNCVTPNTSICPGGTLVGTDCLVPVATACTGTMNGIVSDSSDTRTILTANSSGNALINFDAAYASANSAYFDAARISTLSQWSTLTAAQQAAAQGANLVKYLRGQYGHEDRSSNAIADRLYRYREAVLGDALESQPQFLAAPVFSYPYPGYSEFAIAQSARLGTVYMGTNDGMMHAFAADTGIERWAYVPSMVIPNMWKLADHNYANLHTNFVNGTGTTSDIYDGSTWRTILVGGLNAGGRGYYALDITNPSSPALLWEFTPTTGIGKIKDDDLGYSYGQAVITKKSDGTWVVLVTSGYNNTAPGSGKGFLYVLNAYTGAIISKISTGVGSTTTPSGLSKIAAWNIEPGGNRASYTYGGDLQGNLWRFDINSSTSAEIGTGEVMRFAILKDPSGVTQPITTKPLLGLVKNKRMIYIGTGKYLEIGDLVTTQTQSQYAIMDDDSTTTLDNPRLVLIQQTLANNPDGSATRLAATSINTVDFANGDRGCFVNFPDRGERVNIDSQLLQGTLVVPTIVPASSVCTPGGYGWLNYFDYQTCASSGSVKYDSPILVVNYVYTEQGIVLSPVLANGAIPPPPPPPPPPAPPQYLKKRVLWRELQ